MLRPSERSAIHVQKGVLLLNAEPWLLAGDLLRHLTASLTVIRAQRRSVVFVRFAPGIDK